MVATYYKKATGDYVWHIDCDEFYTDECIENTKKFIAKTRGFNYAHDEYYYYRYYNVVIAKGGKTKFWNSPARVHMKRADLSLTHRPQLIMPRKGIIKVPREVGIRHHYSIMDLERVKAKAQFYGLAMHRKYFYTYKVPIHDLIRDHVSVRPDNNRKANSIPAVLKPHELEVPPGVSELFAFYKHKSAPWTLEVPKPVEKRMAFPEKFTSSVIYPIPPAFDKHDNLDGGALSSYLQFLHENGGNIILTTAGTTRFNMLTENELRAVNDICMSFSGVKILGLPSLPEKHMRSWVNASNDLKPDAVLLMYPDRYYSDDDVTGYFYRLADQLQVPAMIHGMCMRNAVAGGFYEFYTKSRRAAERA